MEDTQRLVTEIEMLKVVLYLVSRKKMESVLEKKKQLQINDHSCYYHCSICGKGLKFTRISDYPLACWQCMIVNADS